METLEIKIGMTCKIFADSIDAKIRRQKCLTSIKTQLAQKRQLLEQNEIFEEAEGLLYGSGNNRLTKRRKGKICQTWFF